MASDVGNELPPQVHAVESPPKPPELRTRFNEAARLGSQLTNIDQARRNRGLSCFRVNGVLTDFSRSLATLPDAELSNEKVLEAQRATLGITLEGARQIKKGETTRPQGVREDMESLGALIRNIADSSAFAEKLKAINPEAYRETAEKVFAAELGKKPEELGLDEKNLTKLVADTYSAAQGKLQGQANALNAYLGR